MAHRMMKRSPVCVFLILLVWVLSLQCQANRSYHLHIGEPFYPSGQLSYMRFLGEDAVPDTIGSVFRLRGIYTMPDTVSIRSPLLRFFDERSGLRHALLLTELDVEDGDLVEVSGTVWKQDVTQHGAASVLGTKALSCEEVHLLQPSSRLKAIAQEEYLRIRRTLQKAMTLEGSHLILPEGPRWFVVWSKTDESFIVSFRQADLMYQAEIDCIIDGTTEIITHVYAFEWFKGE